MKPSAKHSKVKGFTLTEMLLVIAVIGLMATVVSGSLDSVLPKERLNTAVRNLTALLSNTRSEAVSRSLEFFVEYDLEEARYRQVTPFNKEGRRFMEEDMTDEERFNMEWQLLPPGVQFSSVAVTGDAYTDGHVTVRFDPRGAASDHQVVLTQPAYDNYYTIEVMALTGTFKFHRGEFIREAPDDRDFE